MICPDLRGFGWTDAPRGGYLKRELAADVVALLDVLGLERVRLAGHDWGGFVGFLLCLEAPERDLALRGRRDEPPLGPPRERASARAKQTRRLSYMALIAAPVVGKQVMRRSPASRAPCFRVELGPSRADLDRRRDGRVRRPVEGAGPRRRHASASTAHS